MCRTRLTNSTPGRRLEGMLLEPLPSQSAHTSTSHLIGQCMGYIIVSPPSISVIVLALVGSRFVILSPRPPPLTHTHPLTHSHVYIHMLFCALASCHLIIVTAAAVNPAAAFNFITHCLHGLSTSSQNLFLRRINIIIS